MKIRPVTDLRNHFPEVEMEVKEEGAIYLTKNGYASAVLLSVEEYEAMKSPSPAPKASDKPKAYPCHRGFFHKYANSDLIPFEKEAGYLHVMHNYKKYLPGGGEDE